MDLDNLSNKELIQLIKHAENQLVINDNKAFDDAYLEVLAIAKKVGLTVQELDQHGINRKLNKIKAKAEIKYRNKAKPEETWTGRGKQPRWLSNEIVNGAKLEDFLV